MAHFAAVSVSALAFLLLTYSIAPGPDEPPVPDPDDICACFADKECTDHGCSGWITECDITVIQHGECDDVGCQNTRDCKWNIHLKAVAPNVNDEVKMWQNGVQRLLANGMLEIGPMDRGHSCGNQETYGLGNDSTGPCVEGTWHCEDCGP